MKKSTIKIQDKVISVKLSRDDNDYISLTDMAKFKNNMFTSIVISNWLSTKYTIQFIGSWEQMHNQNFNAMEFNSIKNMAGTNGFILSSSRWIAKTGAIGIRSVPGRYGGGTFAHRDIAFEFATWLSPEFKLYLIKEFQRLKTEENKHLLLGWDVKRMLTKINYRIHADAIKEHLIPERVSGAETNIIYASEGDVLNKALFGLTAKEWRDKHPKLAGNIRDYADVTQLVCLANLENLNAEYIRAGLPQKDRLIKLNQSAIAQMKSLIGNASIKKLQ